MQAVLLADAGEARHTTVRRTGFGPGGQAVNGLLAYAEQAAADGDASSQTWAFRDEDGMLHVPDGTVCTSCWRTMKAPHAARRSPDGWRHESCPS